MWTATGLERVQILQNCSPGASRLYCTKNDCQISLSRQKIAPPVIKQGALLNNANSKRDYDISMPCASLNGWFFIISKDCYVVEIILTYLLEFYRLPYSVLEFCSKRDRLLMGNTLVTHYVLFLSILDLGLGPY